MAVNKNRTIALLIGRAGVCGEVGRKSAAYSAKVRRPQRRRNALRFSAPTLRSELTRQSLWSFAEVTDDPVRCYKATLSPSAR